MALCSAPAAARPGTFDSAFGATGLVVTGPAPGTRESPVDMAEASDGSLVVAGSSSGGPGSIVFKYLPGGQLDPEFGDQGQVRIAGDGWEQVKIQGDGRILLAGGNGFNLTLARLAADGSLDPTFGGTGQVNLATNGLFTAQDGIAADASISSLAVLPDGGLRVIGSFAGCSSNGYQCADAFIAGVDSNGSPTLAFGASGVRSLGIQGAGMLSTTTADGNSLVIRSWPGDPPYGGSLLVTPVSTAGTRGTTAFLTRGLNYYYPALGQYPGDLEVDPSGRILFTDGNSVWRLLSDGSLDDSFGEDGRGMIDDLTRFLPGDPTFYTTGITTDQQGRILVSGGLGHDGEGKWPGDAWASSGAVGRLEPDGTIDNSFGGGGLAIAWTGNRAGRKLTGNTSIATGDSSLTVVGMGPAGGDFGFTLARLENDEMTMPMCHGKEVDYLGTPESDRVEAHMTVVSTLGGNDIVTGGYRATICSGAGPDRVIPELGPAQVYSGPGNDLVRLSDLGTRGVNGGPGDDRIYGGKRPDRLLGADGNDLILGGGRDDRIFGGPGRDRLYGQGGRDWLFGGPGSDLLRVGPIAPDPDDYVFREGGGSLKLTTLGKKASAYLRVPLACRDSEDRLSNVTMRAINFDPVTGKLGRVAGSWDDIWGDYGGFVSDIRGQVQDGRIKGDYRIIDNWDGLCRTGDGPLRLKTLLRDAWVPFSTRVAPKPRQIARQN